MNRLQIPTTALGGMQRARSVDEYVDLVRQALDECADLRAAMEYDMDAMGAAAAFLEPLETGLQRLYQAFQDGSQYFVLLILTDGIITDFNQTIAAIIEVPRHHVALAMRF